MKHHILKCNNFAWFSLALFLMLATSLLILPVIRAQESATEDNSATPQAVTNGRIAFQSKRDGNYEIYTTEAAGANPRNLTNNPANDITPAWSPDGTQIAFASDRANPGGNVDLYVVQVNADGSPAGTPARLTTSTLDNVYPTWSPDGKRIAFMRGQIDSGDPSFVTSTSQIYIIDVATKAITQFTRPDTQYITPAWSPDGTKIAFARKSTTSSKFFLETGVVNADNTIGQIGFASNSDTNNITPAWSPDGTKLVFTSDRSDPLGDIWLVDLNGPKDSNGIPTAAAFKQLTRSTFQIDAKPVYSPDGTKIAWMRGAQGSGSVNSLHIFTMNADGSNQNPIAGNSSAEDSYPSWQPVQSSTSANFVISGKVTEANGTGVSGVTVRITEDLDTSGHQTSTDVKTDASGSYSLTATNRNHSYHIFTLDQSFVTKTGGVNYDINPPINADVTGLDFKRKVNTTVDLSLTMSGPPSAVTTADTFRFQPLVRNDSTTSTATNVKVTDTIPAGATFDHADAADCSASGNTVTCNLGSIAPGASYGFLLYFKAAQAGKYTNTATVSATETDPNTSNNTASADAFVNSAGQPVVITSAIGTLPTLTTGVPFSYTLTARGTAPITYNINGAAVPGLTFNDTTISGTPTQAGQYTFSLKATNAAGTDQKTVTLNVVAPKAQGSTPTPAGGNVSVSVDATNPNTSDKLHADVTFSQVQKNGTTTLSLLDPDAALDSLVPLIPSFISGKPKPVVFDVSTSATITPPVQVCIPVPDEYKPLLSLGKVRLFHGVNINANGQTLTFEDATTKADASAGIICATTKSLSPFILAVASNTVGFKVNTFTANEADGKVTITVSRTGDVSQPATVRYSTSSGTASERMDFISAYGTLQFAAGETEKSFDVLLENDVYTDQTKSFTITLSDATGAAVDTTNATATVNITNNAANNNQPNPINTVDFFVRQQYYDFFSRQPDAAGLAFWTNEYTTRVAACNSVTPASEQAKCVLRKRAEISDAFFLSTEFQETGYFVIRFYQEALGRLPTFKEFLTDTQAVGKGVIVGQTGYQQVLAANKQAFAANFVQRAEFLTSLNNKTNGDYLNALFANGGAATTDETDLRTQLLTGLNNSTETRATVLAKVADSKTVFNAQYNKAFVLLQYFGYLRRNPNDPPDNNLDGFNFWLNKLNSFTQPGEDARDQTTALFRVKRAEMVEAFLDSTEYKTRFGPQ